MCVDLLISFQMILSIWSSMSVDALSTASLFISLFFPLRSLFHLNLAHFLSSLTGSVTMNTFLVIVFPFASYITSTFSFIDTTLTTPRILFHRDNLGWNPCRPCLFSSLLLHSPWLGGVYPWCTRSLLAVHPSNPWLWFCLSSWLLLIVCVLPQTCRLSALLCPLTCYYFCLHSYWYFETFRRHRDLFCYLRHCLILKLFISIRSV